MTNVSDGPFLLERPLEITLDQTFELRPMWAEFIDKLERDSCLRNAYMQGPLKLIRHSGQVSAKA